MKKIATILVAIFASFILFAQNTIELTFTATNNEVYFPLDSALIENITQGGDTTLYAPDTVLILDYISGIEDQETFIENGFIVNQNIPNPFTSKTSIELILPVKENIKINIHDFTGRRLINYDNILKAGIHKFIFYPGKSSYYLLTVKTNLKVQTIKMISLEAEWNSHPKLIYEGNNSLLMDLKSQKSINDFGYNMGDELMFTVYAITAIGNLGSSIVVDIPEMNTVYTFDILEGLRCPGIPTVTDIEGNLYNTVLIGEQCWTKENLKTTSYNNGTPIPNIIDDTLWSALTTGAYVWYEHDLNWKDLYGGLYNWFATVDTNGLCPTGWHVPTDAEWTILTDFIGGIGSPHGSELKSCRQVNSPIGGICNTVEHPRWSEHSTYFGTDNYGFSGLPGGMCGSDGIFYSNSNAGDWWSTTESGSNYSLFRELVYCFDDVAVGGGNKRNGYAVRCIKD